MRLSQSFSKTLREAPLSAESRGYGMLLRAGYIKQIGSGIFDLLPFGRLRYKIEIESTL